MHRRGKAILDLTFGSRAFATAFLLGCACVLAAPSAAADEPVDTVLLKTGAKLRGTVIEEDPDKGVTIRLRDATTRKLKANEVSRVEYGKDAAPTVAPPVVPTPAPTAPASPPIAVLPSIDQTAPKPHGGSGLFIAGLVVASAGALTAGVGGVLYSQTNNAVDPTITDVSIGMAIVGASAAVTGLIFVIVGAPSKDPNTVALPLGPGVALRPTGSGFAVSF